MEEGQQEPLLHPGAGDQQRTPQRSEPGSHTRRSWLHSAWRFASSSLHWQRGVAVAFLLAVLPLSALAASVGAAVRKVNGPGPREDSDRALAVMWASSAVAAYCFIPLMLYCCWALLLRPPPLPHLVKGLVAACSVYMKVAAVTIAGLLYRMSNKTNA